MDTEIGRYERVVRTFLGFYWCKTGTVVWVASTLFWWGLISGWQFWTMVAIYVVGGVFSAVTLWRSVLYTRAGSGWQEFSYSSVPRWDEGRCY